MRGAMLGRKKSLAACNTWLTKHALERPYLPPIWWIMTATVWPEPGYSVNSG